MTKLEFVLIFFLIFFIGEKAIAQLEKKNLKEYSYHMIRFVDNKPTKGCTGFFLKKDEKFYFVSAWHCFSSKNHITKKYSNPKDSLINEVVVYRNISDIKSNNYLRVKLKNKSNSKPKYLSISEGEKLLDISAIEIDWSPNSKFDFIEYGNLNKSIKASVGDKVFYHGFPIIKGKQQDNSEYYEGTIVKVNNNPTEFIIKINGYIGCSGSPLYILKDNQPFLKGLMFYGLKDVTGRATYGKAIDIKYLIDHLN